MRKRVSIMLLLMGFVLIYFSNQAFGQPAYPTKPVDIIVPWGPGGGTDLCARVIAKYVVQSTGFPMNVVNKPGGGGVVAVREMLMDTKPDGYTMLAETHGGSSMVGAYNEPADIPFDWRKRTWIAMTDKDLVVYTVKHDSPWKTIKDVADFAKKNPEKFRWGTTGRGGISIPAMVQFFQANNIPVEKVLPSQVLFKSGADTVVALAGGHIDICAQQVSEVSGLIEGKKVRGLAVVFEKRLPIFPDVPTVAEAGYPMFDTVGWHGISGPPGLPKHVVDFWATSLEKASKDPVFIDMLHKLHKVAVYLGPKEVEDFVEKEYQKYLEGAKYLGWRK